MSGSCSELAFVRWAVVKIRVPFLGTLNNRCRIILRTPKGTIILTSTQVGLDFYHMAMTGQSLATLKEQPPGLQFFWKALWMYEAGEGEGFKKKCQIQHSL